MHARHRAPCRSRRRVAGFRAAIRTSADSDAGWLFGVADTGSIEDFRWGVQFGVLTATTAAVLLLLPLHAAAWGLTTGSLHAINGAAIGWLLVEVACADVDHPLVQTIPPNDGLNTVGVVFLGAIVLSVVVLARIEGEALSGSIGRVVFPVAMSLAAASGALHK